MADIVESNAYFDEGQRQVVILALAELALSRPGWNTMLVDIAVKLRGLEMFNDLKESNADRVAAQREPLLGPSSLPPENPAEVWYDIEYNPTAGNDWFSCRTRTDTLEAARENLAEFHINTVQFRIVRVTQTIGLPGRVGQAAGALCPAPQ